MRNQTRTVTSRTLYFAILAVFLAVLEAVLEKSTSKFPVVLVVSMDGFRPAYVEDCLTPTIIKLRSSGVYAPFMKNAFPTKTFPNHHTIATGVQPEVHGVLDSTVYTSKDGCSNRTLIGYSYELFHYNNDILPIWTLNQLAGKGRHSGVMGWPGGEYPYGCKKTMPTFFERWDFRISFEERIDTVISWIVHEVTPANLVMLYFEEPDYHGHGFGIESKEVRDQIKKLDAALGYLVQQFTKHYLNKLVTVFVVSDHGMINIKQKNIIDLNSFVDQSKYTTAGCSPVLQVFPDEGSEESVHSGLLKASQQYQNKFDVFTQKEIPNSWHYAANNRTPPILVVAREGYAFQDFYKEMDYLNKLFNIASNPGHEYGIHGYSNDLPTMHPLFFAWGPLVKSGVLLDPFNTAELYHLWAHILDLELAHEVYSSANFSMLSSSSKSSEFTVPPLNANSPSVKGLFSSPLPIGAHLPGTAPVWTYWFAGFIAVSIVIIIIGLLLYFYRNLRSKGLDEIITQNNSVENQFLLASDSEDDEKV